MGNAWFGKRRSTKVVDHHDDGVRFKVTMTRGQLEELMAKMDMSKGDSELGRLVFQECLKGRLHARLVASGKASESTWKYAKGWGLSPIQEHSQDDHF